MMSSRSRRRIMNFIATLVRSIIPLFVTLTYPKDFPTPRASKRHFDTLIKRLKRRYPDIGYIWKIELQLRGAPHYHLFLWGVPNDVHFYWFIKESWYEIVGSGDPWHLVWGAKVENIKSYRGVKSYVSKYIAKQDETIVPEGLGRTWGYGGKIPISEKEAYTITPLQSAKVLRFLLRRIRQHKKNKYIRSFYVDNPQRWLDNHSELTGDEVHF